MTDPMQHNQFATDIPALMEEIRTQEPTRALELKIGEAAGAVDDWRLYNEQSEDQVAWEDYCSRYLTSIDDSAALMPEGVDVDIKVRADGSAEVIFDKNATDVGGWSDAPDEPRARTLAALAVKHAQEQER